MPDRRLAAILAADVVGYSALMAEDEAATLEALRRLRRELFHPAVAGHRGKVVKAMGDGWLVEFASAVDAVSAALRIQTGLERDPKIRVRIGIHVGDITHEDEDIYGDGVNVAARLEALCEPAAVVISDAVYGSLDGTLRPSFDDAGERQLKNLPLPVRIWTFGTAAPTQHRTDARASTAPRDKVIVTIKPVHTTDRRDDVRELAAALTNDLSDLLGMGRWLNAVAAEKPVPGSLVLAPVLRARGERLRLDATLSAAGGTKLWSHRSDGDLGASFDWQDEAAGDFAAGAYAVMLDTERQRVDAIAESDMDAETCLLAAQLQMSAAEKFDLPTIIRLVGLAIERKPDYASAYGYGAGSVNMVALSLGASLPYSRYADTFADWMRQADRLLDRADPARVPLAFTQHAASPDPERLRAQIHAAARKHPFNSYVFTNGALAFSILGDAQAALDFADRAYRVFRYSPGAWGPLIYSSRAHIMLGQDEKALELARQVLQIASVPVCYALAASALAHLGRIDEAHAEVNVIRRMAPGMTVTSIMRDNGYVDNAATRRYFDGLRLAGLPEGEA